ncbi:MAG: GNAT family N-acetyltransferase [Bacteroidales bacterium]|nr:GNAT family N-acetyltransferase [Bacteroidales bacterium]MBQ8033968.1 GNAT family N-acetyltransferase [Bacteroidales bacterium]
MEAVIQPVDRDLILKELTPDKFIRETRKGGNYLFEVTAADSPMTMQEIGRLREISFRLGGGGTGKHIDIDSFDTDPKSPYKQLIVWDPKDQEIIGGYRYIKCGGLETEKMATGELFSFSEDFKRDYLPFTIELGRSFIQPNYQSTNLKRKSLYSLDNLWDGLGALVVKYSNVKYFFGKVTMYPSYNPSARNMLLHFLHKYFFDPEKLVQPITPLACDKDNPYFAELFKDLDYKEGYKILQKELKNFGEHIPPLINSYMNLSSSMKMFGTAINSEFGQVEESGILVNIQDIYPEKIERYVGPLRSWAQKMRIKWWHKK